jgi:hypothetical protein
VERFGNALVAAAALELVVATGRAWWILHAVLLVRVVSAVVFTIASPCLQSALLVAAPEFVGLATLLTYSHKYTNIKYDINVLELGIGL